MRRFLEESFLFEMIVGKKGQESASDRRKTTITGVSRRRSTPDYHSMEHAQSAPSSPDLTRAARQRSNRSYIDTDRMDVVREFELNKNRPSDSFSRLTGCEICFQ